MQEFPESLSTTTYNTYAINNLYVYPQTVSLSGVKKCKNIGVRVQLRHDDGFDAKSGLKVIFISH
jgi:hypothetical protein